MSTASGGRGTGPKHNNRTAYKAFRNDKDKRRENAKLAPVTNLCERCIEQVEWKRKYGKYKKLTTPAKCKGCHGRKVKTAYRSLCDKCASEKQVCPKCMQAKGLVTRGSSRGNEEETLIKGLEGVRERVKRTIVRRYLRGDLTVEEAIHEAQMQRERQMEASDLDESDIGDDEYEEEHDADSIHSSHGESTIGESDPEASP